MHAIYIFYRSWALTNVWRCWIDLGTSTAGSKVVLRKAQLQCNHAFLQRVDMQDRLDADRHHWYWQQHNVMQKRYGYSEGKPSEKGLRIDAQVQYVKGDNKLEDNMPLTYWRFFCLCYSLLLSSYTKRRCWTTFGLIQFSSIRCLLHMDSPLEGQ